MNTQPHLPVTQNPAWGFWGTMDTHAAAAWPLAMTAISESTGEPLDSVRAFLDSRHGRQFADSVLNAMHSGSSLPEAIATITRQWMSLPIDPKTARDHGIPRGLSHLTGFVIHCAIVEDDA